jgi:Flp pilus assembly protein TadD
MRTPNYLLVLLLPLLATACGPRAAYKSPPPEPALVETPQNDRAMYLDLLRQMQDQGAYFASLAHIDAFRQRFGDSPELRVLQADALRQTGENAAATQLYRGLLKGPQAASAWHGLGLIAASDNDLAQANLALRNAVQSDPLNVTYLGDLGFALLQSGDTELARAPLAKAAELAPGNARAVSNLALWALLSGQSSMAEAMIQRANLPNATRQEIHRLAQTLRRPAAASAGPQPPLAAQQSASATALPPLPPGSMLDRFNPAAKPQELIQ